MTDLDSNIIEIDEAIQRLQQEQATFDLRKNQEEKWFRLKLTMGYTAVVLRPTIAGVSSYIILNAGEFSSPTVAAASAALFADVLGMIGAVWKVVVNPDSVTRLEPVTRRGLADEADTARVQIEN